MGAARKTATMQTTGEKLGTKTHRSHRVVATKKAGKARTIPPSSLLLQWLH